MLRVANDLARRPLLDDAAEVHDGDAVREVGGRREVVRDHQDSEALVPEAVQEAEDTRPHRHVEHRDRLVGHEELGVEDQARGDRDALPLAAGKLVWVAIDVQLWRRQPRPCKRVPHPLVALFSVPDPVDDERLLDGRPHLEARVERLVRILVDDLHPPAERPEPARREPGDLLAAEPDRPRARMDHAHERLRRRRLPAARLAHQGEHLARPQREGHTVDRVHELPWAACERAGEPPRNGVVDDEVFDLEERAVRAHEASRAAASFRWQAASWPGATTILRGTTFGHGAKTRSQRGANGQPTGSRSRRGGTPGIDTTSPSP